MRSRLQIALLLQAISLLACLVLTNQRVNGAQRHERLYSIVIDGMLHGRQKLISGEFSATEHRYDITPNDERLVPSEIYCAFDNATGALRFDRTHSVIDGTVSEDETNHPSTETSQETQNLATIEITSKYGRTLDSSLHWISVEWQHVNEPIDDTLFTPRGFGLTEFAKVIDTRLGTPVVVEVLNGPTVPAATVNAESQDDSRAGGARALLLWGNVILLIAIVVYWVFRKR